MSIGSGNVADSCGPHDLSLVRRGLPQLVETQGLRRRQNNRLEQAKPSKLRDVLKLRPCRALGSKQFNATTAGDATGGKMFLTASLGAQSPLPRPPWGGRTPVTPGPVQWLVERSFDRVRTRPAT